MYPYSGWLFIGDHLERSTDLGLKNMVIQGRIQGNKTPDPVLLSLCSPSFWLKLQKA